MKAQAVTSQAYSILPPRVARREPGRGNGGEVGTDLPYMVRKVGPSIDRPTFSLSQTTCSGL